MDEQIDDRYYLITAALDFGDAVMRAAGVLRFALVGSLTTNKPKPKDADVLVTIDDSADIAELAALGRKLKGTTQRINCGADVFLANPEGRYLGRTCHWRDCRPGIRMACNALHCGRVPHLYDDLQVVKLSEHLIRNPPVVIYPTLMIQNGIPADLMSEITRRTYRREDRLP